MENMAKQIKLLQIVVGVLVLTVIFLLVREFKSAGNSKELTVERINIVEPDGTLKLVISNKVRQHPGAIDGKTVTPRERDAGLIFFNNEGDECGGLLYNGNKKEAGMVYSIDQYKNDQIMQLQYSQDNSGKIKRSYGFRLWDRSDDFKLAQQMAYVDSLMAKKDDKAYKAGINQLKAKGYLGTERLFLGKTKTGQTGLFLNDANGKPRLTICIDSLNHPVIQTLDEKGAIIATLGSR